MISQPLVSLQDLLIAMPVRAGDASYSEKLVDYAGVATGQIETATNRYFTRQAHVKVYRTLNTGSFVYDFAGHSDSGLMPVVRSTRYVLRGYPLVEGTLDVRYDPTRAFGDDTVVPATDYLFDAETGVLVLLCATVAHPGALRISYTAGYEVETTGDGEDAPFLKAVPADLKLACLTQVQYLFNKLSPDNLGVSVERGSKTVPAAYFTRNGGLTPEAGAMVAHRRQPLLGLS